MWLWVALALASSPTLAEHRRLAEEMDTLSQRNAWSGVDRAYRQILDLKGVEPTFEEHVLAASAAQALGDVNDTWDRLQRASDLRLTDSVSEWLAQIYANYNLVDLRVSKKVQPEIELEPQDMMSIDPTQRRAVDRCQEALVTEGRCRGLLPLGRYQFGDQILELIGFGIVKAKAKRL